MFSKRRGLVCVEWERGVSQITSTGGHEIVQRETVVQRVGGEPYR